LQLQDGAGHRGASWPWSASSAAAQRCPAQRASGVPVASNTSGTSQVVTAPGAQDRPNCRTAGHGAPARPPKKPLWEQRSRALPAASLLATAGDVASLAASLRQLIKQPALRRTLALAARDKVRRDFDLQRNVAALGGIFAAFPQAA